jgi:hypothetical protein
LKNIFFTKGFPWGEDEVPTCFKNGVICKAIQLHNGGFAYI